MAKLTLTKRAGVYVVWGPKGGIRGYRLTKDGKTYSTWRAVMKAKRG